LPGKELRSKIIFGSAGDLQRLFGKFGFLEVREGVFFYTDSTIKRHIAACLPCGKTSCFSLRAAQNQSGNRISPGLCPHRKVFIGFVRFSAQIDSDWRKFLAAQRVAQKTAPNAILWRGAGTITPNSAEKSGLLGLPKVDAFRFFCYNREIKLAIRLVYKTVACLIVVFNPASIAEEAAART
jgi:hypothetical protein